MAIAGRTRNRFFVFRDETFHERDALLPWPRLGGGACRGMDRATRRACCAAADLGVRRDVLGCRLRPDLRHARLRIRQTGTFTFPRSETGNSTQPAFGTITSPHCA